MIAARTLTALIWVLGLLVSAGGADTPNLKQAEAEADKLDPGWRLDDLEARRAKVAPGADGAPRVLAVVRSLPQDWADFYKGMNRSKTVARVAEAQAAWDAVTSALEGDPTRPIDPEMLAPLKAGEAELRPMMARARELARYPTGRYPFTRAHNPLETPLSHLQEVRQAARLLSIDGHVRALTGDIDGALASARAILGVARSIGDEPMLISQLVRMAVEAVAVDVIQTALARGQASEAALAATQAALADEAAQPLLLHAMRGERAMNYDLTGKVASGEIDADALGGGKTAPPPAARKPIPAMLEDQAICLHLLTRAVEIAKKPLPDQLDLWDSWEPRLRAAEGPVRPAQACARLPSDAGPRRDPEGVPADPRPPPRGRGDGRSRTRPDRDGTLAQAGRPARAGLQGRSARRPVHRQADALEGDPDRPGRLLHRLRPRRPRR